METMSSKNRPAPAPLPPAINPDRTALIARIKAEEGFPVHELTFFGARPSGPDLPIPGTNGGVAKIRASEDVKIDYLHKFRAHRLVIKKTNRATSTEVVILVPESWCSWEV
jgi:hypothetical protein